MKMVQKVLLVSTLYLITGLSVSNGGAFADNYSEGIRSITLKSLLTANSNLFISTFVSNVNKYGGVMERLADIDEIMYPGLHLQEMTVQGNDTDLTYIVNCQIPYKTKLGEVHCPLEYTCGHQVLCQHFRRERIMPTGNLNCENPMVVNVYDIEVGARTETHCSRWYSVYTGPSISP